MRHACLFIILAASSVARAQPAPGEALSSSMEPPIADVVGGLGVAQPRFEDSLTFREGTITLGAGLATVELGDELRYLDPEDADRLLQQWGNLPDPNTLGMLVPTDRGLFEPSTWAVILSYVEDGHVSDEDADEIDYGEILTELRSDTRLANAERRQRGLSQLELIGWAEPPRYDSTRRQLYWAQHLEVHPPEGVASHEVNYSIRMLGRRGVLELNALAAMETLPSVRAHMAELFPRVQFARGHRYSDFDPEIDEVAAYGIGALVLGKVLAKTGVLAVIGAFLLKGWKIILVLFGVIAAFFRRLIGRKPPPDAVDEDDRAPA